MKLRRQWLIASAVLATLWTAVAFVDHSTEPHIATAEKVLNLMNESPWLSGAKLSTSERATHLDRVVTQMVRLNFEQRREMRMEGEELLEQFFGSLTEAEQKDYVDRTVQPHFDAVMKGIRAMTPDDRRRMMSRVRQGAPAFRQQQENGKPAASAQPKNAEDQKFMDEFADIGFEEYFRNATTEEKMKLAPLIEDMHTRVRGTRR